MKARTSWLLCIGLSIAIGAGCAGKDAGKVDALQKENAALKAKVQKLEAAATASASKPGAPELPASLEALFPPKAEQPIYSLSMMAMAMPLEAMVADLFEKDAENAKKDFEAFAEAYAKNRDLVPEWSDMYPQGPVDELGKALESGDPGQVMPAVGKLGAVCGGCHAQHLAAVQWKYLWKDPSAMKLKDPLSGQEIGYLELMHRLGTAFAAIGADLAQGQKDAAVKQAQAFKALFGELENACGECHDSPREYYVDAEAKTMVDNLVKEVGKAKPDPAKVQQLSMTIGMETCGKCHLVHMPAALSRPHGPPM